MSWSSWLGFGSSPSPASEELQNQPTFDPTTSKDDSYKPLSREERRACWEARDKYFTCLDKHKILDALKEKDAAASKCGTQTQKFEQDCARSWVRLISCLWMRGRKAESLGALAVVGCKAAEIREKAKPKERRPDRRLHGPEDLSASKRARVTQFLMLTD